MHWTSKPLISIGLLIVLTFGISSCGIFLSTDAPPKRTKRAQLSSLPAKYPKDFTTGLVVAIEKPGPLIQNPMKVMIKDEKSGEVYRIQAQWNTRTGIALPPSEYQIRTWVPYMGKDIWETKKEAIIDSGVIAEISFDLPTLAASKATPRLSPYKANKPEKVKVDSAE